MNNIKMSASSEKIQTLIKDAMFKEGIDKYNFDTSGLASKGDGYSSSISYFKVTAYLENGIEKIYNILIKSARSENLPENSPFLKAYSREIYIYSEIFPLIDEVQKEFAIKNTFKNYAKCYSFCKEKKALVLQDLKSLGFVLYDRKVTHNLEHVLYVFQTYAKWHGSSLAMKIRNPDIFRTIKKDLTDLMDEFLSNSGTLAFFKRCFDNGLEILKKCGKEVSAKKIQREMCNFAEILGKMTLCSDLEAETEAVILHGDCWNNNMMFLYNENNATKPVDMAFLDFQVSRVASPILDLSYYLYSVADKSVLYHFDFLLEEYHRALTSYLQQYSISSDEILPLKRLKTSWKKYGRFGLGMASFIIRTELCQENEVVDYAAKITENSIGDFKIDDIELQKDYESRVYDVFNHFANLYA